MFFFNCLGFFVCFCVFSVFFVGENFVFSVFFSFLGGKGLVVSYTSRFRVEKGGVFLKVWEKCRD